MRFDELKIVAPDPAAGWSDAMGWQTLFRVLLGGKGTQEVPHSAP